MLVFFLIKETVFYLQWEWVDIKEVTQKKPGDKIQWNGKMK